MSEIKRHEEGGESPSKPIVGTEIQQQLQRDSILEKPWHGGNAAMERAIQECGISEDTAKKLARNGRDDMHILRMLRRSEPERNFALAYLQHRDDILGEQQIRYEVMDVIASEGSDTMMFWTFAPYLFKAFTERGIPEKEAVRKILLWSKDGVTVANESRLEYEQRTRDFTRLHLKGLEKYEAETRGGWVLGEDPNHISHKFTDQEARHVADLLLAENEK